MGLGEVRENWYLCVRGQEGINKFIYLIKEKERKHKEGKFGNIEGSNRDGKDQVVVGQ